MNIDKELDAINARLLTILYEFLFDVENGSDIELAGWRCCDALDKLQEDLNDLKNEVEAASDQIDAVTARIMTRAGGDA